MVAFCCRNSVSMLGAFAELFSAAIHPWFARHAGGCLESLRCAAGIRRRRSWFTGTEAFCGGKLFVRARNWAIW